jgi:hypothetical protein
MRIPAKSTIHAVLHRHGLVKALRRTTKPPGANLLQQQAKFEDFIHEYNYERPIRLWTWTSTIPLGDRTAAYPISNMLTYIRPLVAASSIRCTAMMGYSRASSQSLLRASRIWKLEVAPGNWTGG